MATPLSRFDERRRPGRKKNNWYELQTIAAAKEISVDAAARFMRAVRMVFSQKNKEMYHMLYSGNSVFDLLRTHSAKCLNAANVMSSTNRSFVISASSEISDWYV